MERASGGLELCAVQEFWVGGIMTGDVKDFWVGGIESPSALTRASCGHSWVPAGMRGIRHPVAHVYIYIVL